MARPIKSGLDYFPLDVNFFDDDKVSLITAEFGVIGEAVILRLLSKIYKNGYYYTWGVDERLLFCRWAGGIFRPEQVDEIVRGCLRRSVFDKQVFEMFKILTSVGIQKRYLQAVGERNQIDIISDFWLVDMPENKKQIVNRVDNPINRPTNEVNRPINTQSKVEESKVEESKVTDTPSQEITLKVSTPKKREKQQPDALQLPFVSQNFSSAWEKLVEMPKWRKKLPVSLQMALNSLGKYSEEFAISLIERAIEGGYQGVVFNDTDQAYERWRKTASSVQTNSRLGHNVEVYGSVKDLIAKKYE